MFEKVEKGPANGVRPTTMSLKFTVEFHDENNLLIWPLSTSEVEMYTAILMFTNLKVLHRAQIQMDASDHTDTY